MDFAVRAVDFDPKTRYDLAITTIGYEWRSSHLLRRGLWGRTMMPIAFEEMRIFSYEKNHALSLAAARGNVYSCGSHDRVEPYIHEWAASQRERKSCRVAVDISSMTRTRLASLVLALHKLPTWLSGHVVVDFFYSPGAFVPPPEDQVGPLEIGPVLPEFSGRLRKSSLPVGVVIGMGYEPHRAIGAFEWLEPNRAWAFTPTSPDERFEAEIAKANSQLIQVLGPSAIFNYEVAAGADTVYQLESFIFALKREFRMVLLPMGPKIFALACLLLGLGDDGDRPAVWRVGESTYRSPVDVHEQGPIIGISAELAPG